MNEAGEKGRFVVDARVGADMGESQGGEERGKGDQAAFHGGLLVQTMGW